LGVVRTKHTTSEVKNPAAGSKNAGRQRSHMIMGHALHVGVCEL